MEREMELELEKLSANWEVGAGLSPKFPLEVISALLAEDSQGVEPDGVLSVLRRPGNMFSFEKSAHWTGRPGQALEELCGQLEREAARAHAQFGGRLRVLVHLLLSPDISLDAVERCVGALSQGGEMAGDVLFGFRFQPELSDHTIVARGLIGGEASRDAR